MTRTPFATFFPFNGVWPDYVYPLLCQGGSSAGRGGNGRSDPFRHGGRLLLFGAKGGAGRHRRRLFRFKAVCRRGSLLYYRTHPRGDGRRKGSFCRIAETVRRGRNARGGLCLTVPLFFGKRKHKSHPSFIWW